MYEANIRNRHYKIKLPTVWGLDRANVLVVASTNEKKISDN